MFNVGSWARGMRSAIAANDAERAAQLMYENDHNGCFSYESVCHEFGEMTREEWAKTTIECAVNMLGDLEEEIRFLVRDESGRGFTCEVKISEFTDEERAHVEDEDDPENTFGEWLDNSSAGEEYKNTDENYTVIRIN